MQLTSCQSTGFELQMKSEIFELLNTLSFY